MVKRSKMVAGNWKMNGDSGANASLMTALGESLAGFARASGVDIVVCPPFPYIAQVVEAAQKPLLAQHAVGVGAQNLCADDNGAFTGEVSASMLMDLGCNWVIIGHSERRAMFADTDAVVAAKVAKALASGLRIIVCIGESLADREAGRTEAVLGAQLDAFSLAIAGADAERVVVAYEPVWAIGTGKTASPEMAQETHAFVRARLQLNHVAYADSLRILYGGSVKAGNAKDLFGMADIDGGLIGGASLVAQDFAAICQAAAD